MKQNMIEDADIDWREEEIPLFPNVTVASSFSRRVRGLLGTKASPQMMLITPCHSIHTFGMEYPINVAFFDKDGIVLDAETSVPPGSQRSCDRACGVLEMPAMFQNNWFTRGDRLRLAPPEACRPEA